MPLYRIYYLTEEHTEKFRYKSPVNPSFLLYKSRYEEGPAIEASTPYMLWQAMRDQETEQEQSSQNNAERPINIGDALQTPDDELLLCNYWGFDKAEWRSSAQPEQPGEHSSVRTVHTHS